MRHYFDHNATSPLRPAARDAMFRVWEQDCGNASSLHQEGRQAKRWLDDARESVAALVGARGGEVVFTSGGSEAIASAMRGVTDRAPHDRKRILVGATEHSAILESAKLAAKRGCVVVTVPCHADGRIDLQRFRTMIGDDVALAALQWANNETGVLQPVEELARTCREVGVPFLVDAVQAAGKVPVDFRTCGADMMALSAHKVGGPQGSGALVLRRGIELAPLIGGGAQEMRRRGGTEAVALHVGYGAAAEEALQTLETLPRQLLRMRAKLETQIRELFPDVRFHGEGAPRLPNTVNFSIPGLPGEMLVIALDLAGFSVSTGSACASGAVEPSHVLLAMGLGEEEARQAIRLSFGWNSQMESVERFLEAFPEVAGRVRENLQQA